MESGAVKIIVWKEGKNILIRNEEFHINTYGKNFEEALQNFHDAYVLNILGTEKTKPKLQNLTLVLDYPQYLSEKSKAKMSVTSQ